MRNMQRSGQDSRRRVAGSALAAWAAGLLALGVPALAQAADPPPEFGVSSFTTSVLNAEGGNETQASVHPFSATASFTFTTKPGEAESAGEGEVPVEDPKTIITDLPPGFVGNPQAAPTCTTHEVEIKACPVDSQVGIASVGFATTTNPLLTVPVYNIEPTPGHPAIFGFLAGNAGIVFAFPELRSDGDYGVSVVVPYAQQFNVYSGSLTFWGVPADDAHDAERYTCYFGFFCSPPTTTDAPLTPFLTTPATECTDKQPVTALRIDSWQHPGVFKRFEAVSPKITGCDKLTFEPSVDISPTVKAPDAPTGLKVDMAFPQGDNAEGLAPPALKKAVVTFPEGMTINPAGASGLMACADENLKLKSKDPVSCPTASKVGTVTATSPLLKEELTGGVYVRSQSSSDPESGEMFRIALVLENKERGISVRLPGQIRANKDTGRLETTFDNNPELPVSDLSLQFKDGPNAPLATPPTCGEKTITTKLTSWGGQTVTRTSGFTIDCTPGLGGFGPSFAAGAVDPVAAASSPFTLGIRKPDGNAALDGLRLELPEGLLADINGNLGTRVGTATVAAGPGSQPFWLSGPVVLEGAYGDAPYSLRVTVPAKAGPFDLGDVVVRQKIYVDPRDAHVTVVSDPLPVIVKGVPVRLQKLNVSVDKPGFMRNPTSCAEKTIGGDLHSVAGITAHVASRFQVGGCEGLALRPELKLTLTGRVGRRPPRAQRGRRRAKKARTPKSLGLTDGGHPDLDARLTMSGGANLKQATVALPLTMALDPDNANGLCEPADAAANKCPAASIVGNVTAISPILPDPLTGPVYFVRGERVDAQGKVRKTLPKLYVPLTGSNGVRVDLHASSDVNNFGQLVTTFDNIPDAPVSDFRLHIAGGAHGILVVTLEEGPVRGQRR